MSSDTACHLHKEREIKQEDGVGAVTSTVLFLLNSVTLGQVKAGTSSSILLVLAYLSAQSVWMTLILEPAVLAGTFRRGWGENSQIYTSALWFPNFSSLSGLLSVKLNVLIDFLQTLRPPLIPRLSVSLPNLFCFLGGSSLQNLPCLFLYSLF